MILSTEQQPINEDTALFSTEQHEGKITQIGYGYYSNPQIYIFGCTYILAVGLSVLMATQVFIVGYHYYIGKLLCLYILYRYMNLAFSNPGLSRQNLIKMPQNHKFCSICQLYTRKYTRHCQICNVCIEGYDHHCIFIGKCIGAGNLGQFKQFLCVIFGTLAYALVISIMMATNIKSIGNSP